ncbi:hypothetical protein BCR33DRAFT_848356 [Rhizoclosmatium globosum]|uniref:DUF2306 domain-containing protein n=1 Tax=Rhizoclosmatium globosum TaxID=329046 RepID=A0A1Y2CKS3_9FUNG|nr:hypothetical protein BCR33DRAFT_848356 [Rhizoclosmatium globosum]|eukprot:ORY47612.1 hypothetical protein BCR33DRAFT_848356 [Rhizoclosmatium globosum]
MSEREPLLTDQPSQALEVHSTSTEPDLPRDTSANESTQSHESSHDIPLVPILIKRSWTPFSVAMTILSTFFNVYILAMYLVRNPKDWFGIGAIFKKTVMGTVSMYVHFVGGFAVNFIGIMQLVPWIRSNYIELHRWCGRVYLIGVALAVAGGSVFVICVRTIGGIEMDVAFLIYGGLMAYFGVRTWLSIRGCNVRDHRRWAIRLFAMGIGSALYRVYMFPLYFAGRPTSDEDRVWMVRWLNAAAWAMFVPNLILCEIILNYTE